MIANSSQDGRHASLGDPPLIFVRAAASPVVPEVPVHEVLPLESALPVVVAAFLGVWALHCLSV